MGIEVDKFASSLLEEAKRFLEKASECDEGVERDAYLHAALLLVFSSLDAHINAIAMDFQHRTEFTPHERSVLFECDVNLKDGKFVTNEKALKMWKLDERIEFFHRRLSGKAVDKSAPWWSRLGESIGLRNDLTHPKKVPQIDVKNVGSAIQAIIDTLVS